MAEDRRPPRLQSPTERELASEARRKSRPYGVPIAPPPVPQELDLDEITGAYEGEELRERRAKRPTDERIQRLEDKHDSLVRVVTETRIAVAEVSGKLEVLPELVTVVKSMAEQSAQREHVTFTAKVDVDKERAKTELSIAKTKWDLAVKALAIVGTLTAIGLAFLQAGKC